MKSNNNTENALSMTNLTYAKQMLVYERHLKLIAKLVVDLLNVSSRYCHIDIVNEPFLKDLTALWILEVGVYCIISTREHPFFWIAVCSNLIGSPYWSNILVQIIWSEVLSSGLQALELRVLFALPKFATRRWRSHDFFHHAHHETGSSIDLKFNKQWSNDDRQSIDSILLT